MGKVILFIFMLGVISVIFFNAINGVNKENIPTKTVKTAPIATVKPIPLTTNLYADDGRVIKDVPIEKISVYGSGWLTEEQKNIRDKKLNAEKIIREKAKEKENLTNKINNIIKQKCVSSYDEVEDISFYRSIYNSEYYNVNEIGIYLGRDKDNRVWLRAKLKYTGEDWLFIQKYIFKIDNATHEFSPNYFNIDREVNYGNVSEFIDVNIDDGEMLIFSIIANSKNTILRQEGRTFRKDRTITQNEKNGIKDIIELYGLYNQLNK